MASGATEDSPSSDTAILVRRDGVELNIKNCSGYIRDRDGTITGRVAVLHDLGAVRAQILERWHGLGTLIHRADTAMYEAKKNGRNNCRFFRPEMQARVLEWQSLEGSLRWALERDEFMLVYLTMP